MRGSLKIGVVAGIGIYLHWTFAILIGWIFFASLMGGGTMGQAVFGVGFILALFACVLLHELGHALTAKHYGIRTRDITLLPIGGLARLERIPENPVHEFWVAIAGPAVNVVIAGILFLFLLARSGAEAMLDPRFLAGDLAARLMWVNVVLVVFNLLPAFPMDGGRVLRALLATRLGRQRATRIAASIGQFMAILFGIIGFMWNPFLIFIAIFVYIGAQTEAELVQTVSMIQGLTVRDGMMTRFRVLSPDDSLETAISELLAGSQQDFPVAADGEATGVLRRQDIIKALAENRRQQRVGEAASRGCRSVAPEEPLERMLEKMREENCSVMPVIEDGRIIGLLTLENISELVMVRSAVSTSGKRVG